MKNFKKLLIANHITARGMFKGIFITYLSFIFFAFLTNYRTFGSDIGKMAFITQISAYFIIASIVALVYIPLVEPNKKLLLSYPLDSLKLYPFSLLIYKTFIFLSFYLVYLIIAFIFKDKLFFNFYIWILNILLFTTIYQISKSGKYPKILTSILIGLLLSNVFLGTNIFNIYSIFFTENTTYLTASLIIFVGLLVYLFIVSLKFNSKNKAVKSKRHKLDKKVKYEKDTNFNFLLKLKSWSSINYSNVLMFAIYLFILIDVIIKSTSTSEIVFKTLMLVPICIISIYDLFDVHEMFIGVPINLIKFHIFERSIKFVIYAVSSLFIVLIANFVFPIFNAGNINIYISAIAFGLITYSIYELLNIISKNAVFIFCLTISILSNMLFQHLSLKVTIFFAIVSIIMMIVSFNGTKKFVETGTSILPPVKNM
ncbi:hypothetical protein SAMN02745245_00492 [Anaerosphaera aminiphila DSM 21120]|uniref:Uncharacterized protein n=1 Tax=Anaerosphaera aminiphila DSM 21120 TaxID=1120995 RepID=A0A1M5PV00_9FIRM|nr:hypothetical protein [Anaerosphaera aminiphila]SHH05847.1 hypothetical protein SAMN02745245_00492 [Anaerosphaera aminiphila DSM 21120]